MMALSDKPANPIPFKSNDRVVFKGKRGTVRCCSQKEAMVQLDCAKKRDSLSRIPVGDLEILTEKDVPDNLERFWRGYLDGVDAKCEGGFYDQHLTGNSYSIGYRKGWSDATEGNIRAFGDDPYLECGGKL